MINESIESTKNEDEFSRAKARLDDEKEKDFFFFLTNIFSIQNTCLGKG
jgi:hypothetical protein